MRSRKVYVVGKNEYGEFGLNHRQTLCKLTLLDNTMLLSINIDTINSGDGYTIYGDSILQKYFVSGCNKYGQCGIGYYNDAIKELTEIKYFTKNKIHIKKICTNIGGSSTFWISRNNRLYSNGWNKFNELGIGDKDNRNVPVKVFYLGHVIDIKCGKDYSIVLHSNNNMLVRSWSTLYALSVPDDITNLIAMFAGRYVLYSTQYSKCGGNGHKIGFTIKGIWKKVNKLKRKDITLIGTGESHSMFLESTGKLWTCGSNLYDPFRCSSNIPTLITYFTKNKIKIKMIKCGLYHNIAVDEYKNIYSWGDNRYGQCGHKNSNYNKYISDPLLIDTLKDKQIKRIKCGAFHSYALTNDNQHYMWGRNKYNECLAGLLVKNVFIPHLINDFVKKELGNVIIFKVCLGYENTKLIVS